jgi:serine phosphatase RsbU (regulator of sigma subunit)/CHASE3 domain sensor protein
MQDPHAGKTRPHLETVVLKAEGAGLDQRRVAHQGASEGHERSEGSHRVEDTFTVRLSLRRKITGGFALLLVLVILLGWVTLSLFGSLRTIQRSIFDEAVPGVVAVDEIVRSYTAQSAAVRGYLIVNQERLLEQYRNEVREAERWQEAAEKLFRDTRERSLLEQLIEAGASYQDLVDERVIPFAEEGRRASAFQVLGSEGASLISEIEFLGSELRAAQDQVVADARSELVSRSNQALAILLLVILGAVFIGSTVAVALPRRLVRNLHRLVDAARAIGRGDFNQELQIKSGDEVEELAHRFGEMQSGLKRLQQLAMQDRELEIAASIQQNLLQRTLPTTPGIKIIPTQRQANLVGGDWYDVDVANGALTVVVGDASGKGIGAALMATVVLSVLRAERGLGSDPKRVVERANDALREATDHDSFTTLVYAEIQPDGTARWLNMGHPPPFLLRGAIDAADRRRGYFLEGPRNRALGWFEEPGLAQDEVQLERGDRLVLFTDGFLEAKSPDGETFGEPRFADAMIELAQLDADALGDELTAVVERYAAGKLDDDLTMIVVEYLGAPAEVAAEGRLPGEDTWHSRR